MTQETKGIPLQIKRNTLYLALVQALVATGFQLVPSLGSLIMLRFTDVLALIGAPLSMGKITVPLMSYPAGILADHRGRKSVLLLGVGLCGAGSLIVPALGGYLAQNFGFPSVGVASFVIAIPIIALASRLRETSPGNYDHP